MRWFSSHGEDEYVFNTFFYDKQDAGTYFEAGAMDGLTSSNTKAFHDMGWRGTLVEPQPLNMHQNRPGDRCVQAGLGPQGSAELVIYHIPNMSHMKGTDAPMCLMPGVCLPQWAKALFRKGEITVPIRTLADVTSEYEYIDFFSLDIEGFEEAALKTFDWNVRVGVWLIEMHEPNDNVRDLLLSHDYVYHSRIGYNDVYTSKHLADRTPYKPVHERPKLIHTLTQILITIVVSLIASWKFKHLGATIAVMASFQIANTLFIKNISDLDAKMHHKILRLPYSVKCAVNLNCSKRGCAYSGLATNHDRYENQQNADIDGFLIGHLMMWMIIGWLNQLTVGIVFLLSMLYEAVESAGGCMGLRMHARITDVIVNLTGFLIGQKLRRMSLAHAG